MIQNQAKHDAAINRFFNDLRVALKEYDGKNEKSLDRHPDECICNICGGIRLIRKALETT